MASVGEEEVEYESDPEEVKRSLVMRRRREASDDEEEGGGGDDRREKGDEEEEDDDDDYDDNDNEERKNGIHSDDSLDDQGGVAEYDDEEEEEEEEEDLEELEEEEVYDEERERDVEGSSVMVKELDGDGIQEASEAANVAAGDGEKKENEPFAVPTAGAFYMHDDRFRDNAGGRHRRMHGGRRLWESKDEKKWGHDKFEELTSQERRYEEGRRVSKGNFRGRSKNRGVDRGGFVRGNKKAYSNRGDQSQLPKRIVRGRGSRRYEPINKNSGPASQTQNKQFEKPLERNSQVSSGRNVAPAASVESDPVPRRKQMFASNLNSASPPFYPSGSSIKEGNLTPKRDVQAGNTSRNVRPGVVDEGFSVQQNNAMLRGKKVADSISLDKLYIDEPISSAAGKPLNNMNIPPGVGSSQTRAPGRGVSIPVSMNYQPVPSHNQVTKASTSQHQAINRSSTTGLIQSSQQAPIPSVNQRPGSGSQASSPPKISGAVNSSDSGDMDVTSESGKFKGAIVGKGKGGTPNSGRGSFVYGGAQFMGAAGNMSASHGDQNFPGTPAFLPVMQFSGQHPGGLGVPALGMAFPGYVAQPQHGMGNNEMTWLPVLAGAAGALGATYCPPYLAVDGAYHTRQSGQSGQSGQTTALGTPSKENNAHESNNEWNPPQRTELVNDEFGQRQNKLRRYSEMKFGQ